MTRAVPARSIERFRPSPERFLQPGRACAILLAFGLAVALASCVGDDGSGEGESSTGAESSGGAATLESGGTHASTSGGVDDGGSGESGSDSADGDGTTSAADSGSSDEGADTTGGPACDPFELTEVRGCDAPVGEGFCSEGAMHVRDGTEIPWMSDPPHSGPHYPMWQTWGEHESSVPRGNWVHNLEHGGIVLAYLCPGGCEAELEVLRAVMEARPDLRILMTPDPLLPGPRFAAISWTWVYRTDTPDLDTLLCFVDQHEGHAPEDVP